MHLTSQLSKVLERVVGLDFLPYLAEPSKTGLNQFAYLKKKGARDLLALLTLEWLHAFNKRMKIAILCSDVSGTFDRVHTVRLLQRLEAIGVRGRYLEILKSWLAARHAVVNLSGEQSDGFELTNQVYQGTVWGPPLWNAFFASVLEAASKDGFTGYGFADDLNSFKAYKESASNMDILDDLGQCQTNIHDWGAANFVCFDASKESSHILSRRWPHGEPFKLLGVLFDMMLTMEAEIQNLAQKLNWKLSTLLKMRRFYSFADMIMEYKARLLSLTEYRTAAIYHAAPSALDRIDRVQGRLLREMG